MQGDEKLRGEPRLLCWGQGSSHTHNTRRVVSLEATPPLPPSSRGAADLPYSSRMTFSTLRTMLPTVVSDGCAAAILRPSARISSISSPARGHSRVTATATTAPPLPPQP